jgi:hypothetical protein
MVIVSSGSQRFDIYAGPFTKNDQLTVNPFLNGFQYMPDVPLRNANQVLAVLNQPISNSRRDGGMSELEERERELYAAGDVEMVYRRWLEEMGARGMEEMRRRGVEDTRNYTLGYVTKDVSHPHSYSLGMATDHLFRINSRAQVSATISYTHLSPTSLSQPTLRRLHPLSRTTRRLISSSLTSLRRR